MDQTESSIRNLQFLHVETSSYILLFLLINDKLPDNLRITAAKNFEKEVWHIEGLIHFLRKEVEVKERSFAASSSFYYYTEHDYDKKTEFSSSALYTQQHKSVYTNKCAFCEKTNHKSNKILKFTDPVARKELVKQKWLCFVCLEYSGMFCLLRNMQVKVCLYAGNNIPKNIPNTNIPKNENSQNNAQDLTTTTIIYHNKKNVLLQTATVSISRVDNKKQFDNVQLYFDSGSQRSHISE